MSNKQTFARGNTDRARRAFTLFEVLMASLILAVGALAAIALFPEALKQQQIARQRIYATSIAHELINTYNEGAWLAFRTMESEVHLTRSVASPDLERAGSIGQSDGDEHTRGDVMKSVLTEPVPPALLARLESENHEIAELARMGAPIFYIRSDLGFLSANRNDLDFDGSAVVDQNSEALNSLIFGVVGYAQQNAMFHAPSVYDDAHLRGRDTREGRRSSNIEWLRHGRYEDPAWWRWRSTLIRVQHVDRKASAAHGLFWECEAQMVNAWVEWPKDPTGDKARFDHGDDTDTALPLLRYETNSLYMPFQANERARQLVFWSVNWKDYVDAERVLPHTTDIGRWGETAGPDATWSGEHYYGGTTTTGILYREGWHRPTDYERHLRKSDAAGSYWDRNFTGEFSEGRIPRTVRLQARTIARFNFYDRRLIMTY